MDRKQIIILVVAFGVLIGGVFLVARSITKKDQTGVAPQVPIVKNQEPANIFSSSKNKPAVEVAEVMGSVEAIEEKTLTIKHLEEKTTININGATPVLISGNAGQSTTGQLADLKVGDAVSVSYNINNQEAELIILTRP